MAVRSREGLSLGGVRSHMQDLGEPLCNRWRLQAFVHVVDDLIGHAREASALRVPGQRHLYWNLNPDGDGLGPASACHRKRARSMHTGGKWTREEDRVLAAQCELLAHPCRLSGGLQTEDHEESGPASKYAKVALQRGIRFLPCFYPFGATERGFARQIEKLVRID